ncbi:acyl-CoA synthetase [Bordetella hinzii]|uniref:Acyl-CoA synthetase n=1 Tax=Bordetella hinzii TaxID=103855 RepID=A0AAN1RWM2_9BORD|nr:acyl-CoA synthetase [Bordetella hinzii]AKQ61544.1 Long-chain-fatty-acid--CoA ligase FadD13 [Bordetella hinzii]AZW17496.1 acyl-CoA synthetase [Bordetella hinzii]KCB46655.1 long-chain-fatty-acid--CoA ligase [Bordetella hinzii 4161]KCB50031.1 long-chain-fatty-acid--CoA ligase [Bordetella hinzii 1277]KXA72115.1 acyl-CoA synthetase [Bordetella hinzii LMG 13501]
MSPAGTTPAGGVAPATRRVMNLATFLAQAARRHPDGIAVSEGGRDISWAALQARSAALAAALAARGIAKGDRVLVHGRNSIAYIETLFAVFRLGAVWVPTNFRISPDEAAYLAQASGARAFLCDGVFDAHARTVSQAMPDLVLLARMGAGELGETDTATLVEAHLAQPADCARVDYDDPCWFFFTSGTTGRPKAAVLTHGQMSFVITNHLCDLMPGTTQQDVSLVVAPLSHGAGIHFLTQVARAARSILPDQDKFDAEAIWALVARHRVSNMFTVPTIVKMLVDHPSVDRHDHSSLRYVIYAGAPMYREDQKRALLKLGPVLVQYFGLGEVTGNITVLPPALHSAHDGPGVRVGSCGYARTGMELSIQDDNGRELGPGESGEICVCGPAVFAGYYANPEANAKAFRDGWFRTGDLGYLDDEGFLYITGRQSDMYISGGSNIYPREIEEKVLAHPAVEEAAVLGVPDPVWGEVGVMVCVLRQGHVLDESALLEWLAPRLARYKLPRRVFFWETLPRSGYGKITKKLVRDALYERGHLPQAA